VPDHRSDVLAGEGLVKRYPPRGGALVRRGAWISAVDGATLGVRHGELAGLVGPSGAGKSTLLRLLAWLERPDAGVVRLDGAEILAGGHVDRPASRRAVQVVFQDSATSLDPRQSVGAIVAEPLRVHFRLSARRREERVAELLAAVGLGGVGEGFLARRPWQLSGGERQRVAIARALACEPRVMLLDEPVAALDAAVRGQVLNLLLALRNGLGVALLLVSHDLRTVARIADRIMVMAGGRIVEEGPAERVLRSPEQAVTRELVGAMPIFPGGNGNQVAPESVSSA
jgi:oligopeptide transport system ATP-binding protein